MVYLLIPWFKLQPWVVTAPWFGAIKLQPFGVLVAIAIALGSHRLQRRGNALGLSHDVISSFVTWTTVIGLLSAYALNIVMYSPGELAVIAAEPARLVRHWYGLSSYGGFIGGALTAVVFARRKDASLVALGDAWCYAFPFAWIFARMGCFVVHDHPGAASDFILAVDNYNETGVARHDLGLYEVIWSSAVSALFLWLDRKPRPAGLYLTLIPLLYGPVRFGLDFLRATPIDGGDVRYCGLTPAQYLSVALTAIGVVLFVRLRATWSAQSFTARSTP
jgi:phosphatidylglycerol:prolipoprotein diacylglycerol transferase